MESSDFIISNLKVWEKVFPKIQIKYAYDDKTEYHIVEIGPHKLYESKELIRREDDFWESFYENFPEEDLCISEPNDLHDMSNLLYENCPRNPTDFSRGMNLTAALTYVL